MRLSKSNAFWTGIGVLILLFGITAFRAPEALPGIGQTIVLSIMGLVGIYTGGNVADNALKGKFYRTELDK